jgi:hypothetical protein
MVGVSAMRDELTDSTSFPVARCEGCGKTVLTYVALDPDGAERRFCTHCDASVEGEPEWVSAEELESIGYYFGSRPPAGGGCGCGASGGGCSRKN